MLIPTVPGSESRGWNRATAQQVIDNYPDVFNDKLSDKPMAGPQHPNKMSNREIHATALEGAS